jgi:archaellum biogenesis ATPase FlaH
MSDIGAIVLNRLVKTKSLDAWARIKLQFLDSSYSSVYSAINKYYNNYNCIPNFEDLELFVRGGPVLRSIAALKELEVSEDLDLDFAIDTLIDTYTQNETLKLLDKFVDNITLMSTQEVKDSLASISMYLDEKTHTSESICTMNSIAIFEEAQNQEHIRLSTGLNNTFDAELGVYRQELVLVGGKRGAGKSIVCANLVANQYEMGNTAAYFTIEMTAKETFEREMSILAGVNHVNLRQNNLTYEEKIRLAKVRTQMFQDGDDLYLQFLEDKDLIGLERKLNMTKHLKPDNQFIIIDDRELSIASIDLHLQKLKAQFGDKLTIVAVDYLNQIIIPGNPHSMYEWTSQIFISKKLKELARKYDVMIVSPFQIDDEGQTRFAKGILDAPDLAVNLDTHEKSDNIISFNMTKIRGGPPLDFTSVMDWDTLRIIPQDGVAPKKKAKKSKEPDPTTADPGGLPW